MLDLVQAAGRATLGELCWVGPSGPTGLTVVPLVLDEKVCAALPFSQLDVARELSGRQAAFAITDQARGGRTTMAGFGRAQVDFDVHGSTFTDRLLGQEIVKYPPTRLRADSLMARRENWWWIARALVTLDSVQCVEPIFGRSRSDQALLVIDQRPGEVSNKTPGGPRLRVVTAPSWPVRTGERVELYPCDGSLLEGRGEQGYVFGHQHSPDLERAEQWYRAGRLDGEQLVIQASEGEPAESLRPYGLWQRFRHHRAIERACRSGIAVAERTWAPET